MNQMTYFDGQKWCLRIGDTEYSNQAVDRLAAYEETGLEPEEIEKIASDVEHGFFHETARRYGIPVDRLRELAKADRDGRCVVLPVKEGEIVYHINFYLFEDYPPEIFSCPFHITDYYNIGNTVFLTEQEAEAALRRKE